MQPSEEIKAKINITDLIGEHVQLKKAGVNFKGICPFHQEKTPSFIVSPQKQIWHCFGCGLGGDIFEFIKQLEGVEFPEALQTLAARVGVVLKPATKSYLAEKDQKKVLYEINSLVAAFYAKILEASPRAAVARDYLLKRGFDQQTIKQWQIGFAPTEFHLTEEFLIKRGYQKKEGLAAGVLSEKDGRYFDRFRGRIMFPLFDLHGRVVGFTGRILENIATQDSQDPMAKYINSPETPIYNKSSVLYGMHLAKSEIRKTDEVVVVEGNIDVIACHQAGYKNVIASSGTALATSQLELIKRFTENLSFAFDVDEAGILAARRAVELALSFGMNVKVITIPPEIAKDPDELIRKDRSLWEKQVSSAQHFLDFYFERTFVKLDLSQSMDKKRAVAELIPLISLLPNSIDRAHYIQLLSYKIGVAEKLVLDFLNRIIEKRTRRDEGGREGLAPRTRPLLAKREILERRILGLLLRFPQQTKDEWGKIAEDDFSVPELRQIFTEVKAKILDSESFELSDFLASHQNLQPQVELLIFGVENELEQMPDWKLDNVKHQFVADFQTYLLREKMETLAHQIRQAEQNGRAETVKDLSSEFSKLSRQLAADQLK